MPRAKPSATAKPAAAKRASPQPKPQPKPVMAEHPPVLEYIASGVGLVIILAMISVLAWEALFDRTHPRIELKSHAVVAGRDGFRVEVEALNTGGLTAAEVEIEGRLQGPGGREETSRARIGYIPAHGSGEVTLIYSSDPRRGDLRLRATAYSKP